MVTLITVAGTWGEKHPDAWFRWGSPWWNEAERRGAQRANVDKYRWSTAIDGIFGENESWRRAGWRLFEYIYACHETENEGSRPILVAHSHGGQISTLATSFGAPVRALITVGTPIRRDMEKVYSSSNFQAMPGTWTHIYSRSDWWQLFGGIGDGSISFRRKMKHAHRNIRAKGMSHADLHSVEAWNKQGWWNLIFGEEA